MGKTQTTQESETQEVRTLTVKQVEALEGLVTKKIYKELLDAAKVFEASLNPAEVSLAENPDLEGPFVQGQEVTFKLSLVSVSKNGRVPLFAGLSPDNRLILAPMYFESDPHKLPRVNDKTVGTTRKYTEVPWIKEAVDFIYKGRRLGFRFLNLWSQARPETITAIEEKTIIPATPKEYIRKETPQTQQNVSYTY